MLRHPTAQPVPGRGESLGPIWFAEVNWLGIFQMAFTATARRSTRATDIHERRDIGSLAQDSHRLPFTPEDEEAFLRDHCVVSDRRRREWTKRRRAAERR